jgi:orotate phosphoribosyltransferase
MNPKRAPCDSFSKGGHYTYKERFMSVIVQTDILNLMGKLLKRQELMELIKEKGIILPHHPITLSSGEKSYYYYDLKMVVGDSKGASLIGELLSDIIEREFAANSVGGLEMGSISISTAVIVKSFEREKHQGIRQFIVRKKAKMHGSEKKVEGYLVDPVVIVDDVMTKGNSVVQAIDAVRNEGYNVAGVVLVIDREDPYNLIKDRIKYFSLFKHSDFKQYIELNSNLC